jgi:hypothetical protein
VFDGAAIRSWTLATTVAHSGWNVMPRQGSSHDECGVEDGCLTQSGADGVTSLVELSLLE